MTIYKLSKNVILETFKDGAAALIVPERRIVVLSAKALEVIQLLNGQRTVKQVTNEMAKFHDFSHNTSVTTEIQDVLELFMELRQSGVLELQADFQENVDMTTAIATSFLRNPDVVLREEDPDEGGLLFNPDTNQVKVINTTGLFIWQQCGVARTLNEIVGEVQKDFDEVPLEQVTQDVQEFVDDMLASGFIGIVETTG